MEIYAHRFLSCLLISFAFCLSAKAEIPTSECKFSVELPPKVNLIKNQDTAGLLCSFHNENQHETPFVNSIYTISWGNLKNLKIDGEPLRDVGFFRLIDSKSAKYVGRPSYVDSQNGYRQKVVRSFTETQAKNDGNQTLVIESDIKVNWIKRIKPGLEKQEDRVFVCVDAVNYDTRYIAILNWCLPKNGSNEQSLLQLAKSLRVVQ